MKKLFPIVLAVCMLLCACGSDIPTSADETTSIPSVTDATISQVDVPDDIKCAYCLDITKQDWQLTGEEIAKSLYSQIVSQVPDRSKSNPAITAQGQTIALVFYAGEDYNGTWSENATYYGLYVLAENGCLTQTGSPLTSYSLNYQLDASVYTSIARILRIPV